MSIQSIMIVDDSETDQFLTEMIITKFDSSIEITKAYDGEEALEILETMDVPPDIILLDINMPRMNGFEFLEEYSKKENRANIIAMLSSSDRPQDKERAHSHKFVTQYFVKPLDQSDLSHI